MSINSRKSPVSFQCPNCLQKKEPRTVLESRTGARGKTYKKIDGKFSVFFCNSCYTGFTYPAPKSIERYYHNNYWISSNLVGKYKDFIFDIFQKRRVRWVMKSISEGNVLDVGSGEGKFGESLPSRYKVTNLESPWAKIKNKKVIKKDFLKWKTIQKFDAICFWESLEHTPRPQKYLEKAYKLLNNKGELFIEFPRYNCLESKLFANNWFHLDLPRHLAHLTDKGLALLLKRSGFKNIEVKNVLSFEYAPWGFTASLVNTINVGATDDIKKSQNLLLFSLLVPVSLLSTAIEIVLFVIKQSPIGLATARK
ncbi:hypothetical protein A2892_03570 [Candidatus Woesebacteria bacterium RIFCSPLOWO2_01_FULL_39_10b]|uniref:Methyltransferase type 11 domain-containing protein n=1 Tax=Candidatus Woesebacteria bacterium RIFCSPLOWO2_01_FULL_39_10b TaxID=1802517 RepID=A0A1F8B5T7_9BACT|nr:MAG: hypothetical protein A2892_03570 [Candidatus Woesebacteria bacterium RIFCSPLOWO2_01_FULL_39_10b]